MYVMAPICMVCIYLNDEPDSEVLTCKAYPDGIPEEIINGKVVHRKPYKGDHGIQFKLDPKQKNEYEELYADIYSDL